MHLILNSISQLTPATFQVLTSHLWLVPTVLDSTTLFNPQCWFSSWLWKAINTLVYRCEGKKWAQWIMTCFLKAHFFSQSTPHREQNKGFNNKAFLGHKADQGGARSSKVGWFGGWRNPSQLSSVESVLSMEKRNLWKTAAYSSSDLLGRCWVMSTLKPSAGRKWGSLMGSYHSWLPPANRREVEVCLPWGHWLLAQVQWPLQQT